VNVAVINLDFRKCSVDVKILFQKVSTELSAALGKARPGSNTRMFCNRFALDPTHLSDDENSSIENERHGFIQMVGFHVYSSFMSKLFPEGQNPFKQYCLWMQAEKLAFVCLNAVESVV